MADLIVCMGLILSLPAYCICPTPADVPPGIALQMARVRTLERNATDLTTKLADISLELMNYKTEIGAIKLNILSIVAGRIPMTGFQAHIKKYPPLIKNMEVLKFDVVTQNRGAGYDRDTGIFTAPREGLYMLWCNIMNYDHTDFLSVYIYKDGKPLAYAYTPANAFQGVASVTTTTFLRKGNRIWFLKFKGSEKILGAGWSSYGGSLIQAT